MILYIPHKVVDYLTSLYGVKIREELKGKKKRLRLINDAYKFLNRI